jgi:DNA-binding IclR family transcriptional regulator
MARPALSAERALRVLNLLTAHPDESFTLSELARRLRINVASMHAILAVLEEGEYATRTPDKRYHLGPMLVPAGRAALVTNDAMSAAGQAVGALAERLGVTGLVVRPNAGDLVIVDEASPRREGTPGIGQRIPMLPPIGGVFFAWAEPAVTEEWIATAPRAVLDAEPDLRRWLASIRERGYAVGLETTARHGLRRAVRDLGAEPGSRAARGRLRNNVANLGDIATVVIELDAHSTYAVSHIAAPIVEPSGECVMSLYLMAFREPLTGTEIEAIGGRLHEAAAAIGRAAVADDAPPVRGAVDDALEGIW